MATVAGRNSRGGIRKVGKNTKPSSSSNTAPSGSSRNIPVSAASAGLTTQQAANERAAQNARFGVKAGEKVTYTPTTPKRSSPVITPEKLDTPPVPPKLPGLEVTNPGDVVGMNNAALAPGLADMGITYDSKSGFGYSSPTETTGQANSLTDLIQQRMQMMSAVEMPSQEKLYRDTLRESGKKAAEADVNAYTQQLNTIVANRDAAMLSLEGQGRGITETIIGGQQAQVQKEAAIRALPVQAQLAAAQGRLDQANEYINTMFTIKSADAKAKYDRSIKIIDTYFEYAEKAEQRQFEDIKAQKAQKYQEEQNLLSMQNQLMISALERGASSAVLSAISNSKSAQEAITAAGPALRPKATAASTKAPDLQNFGTNDAPVWKQWNAATGSWEDINGLDAMGGTSTEDTQKTLDQISFLKNTIKDAQGLADATGPNWITQAAGNVFVGNTRVKQLQNKIDSLKTNLLTISSDPNLKKFFGPQMTENDTKLLMSAGSTLDAYSNSVEDNEAELKRYSDLLNRMETAITENMSYGPAYQPSSPSAVIMTGGDGLIYEIVDYYGAN